MKIQNVLTIAQKELRSYLTNVSNFLVLAGVLLVMAFLFFGNFYEIGVSQLDQLFTLFPWVFAILVPALAMGVIARERQEKTLFYLLAQPITEIELVVGKYIGSFIFLALFPLVTMIIPITLSSVASFDSGVLFAGYVGTLFLLGLFLAVNIAISSIFSNQLAVFVVSFLVNLLLIMIGSSQVTDIVPAFMVDYVVLLSPIDHFARISRGLIELSDILYFLLVSIAALLIAIWQLRLVRGGGLTRQKLIGGLTVQVVAVLLIVAAYFSFLVPGRFDVTDQQVFTLAEGSRNIMSGLSDDLVIDMYLSEDLPPAYTPAITDVTRVIDELRALNPSKITVNWKYPDSDPTLQQEAYALGILPRDFTVRSQTEFQAKAGYFGVNVIFGEENRTIPFITQTSDFEFQVMQLVYDLTVGQKPKIAIVHSADNSPFENATGLVDLLESGYEVVDVQLADTTSEDRLTASTFDGVSAILVTKIGFDIADEDVQIIQDAVDSGVGLVVMSDGVDIDMSALSAVTSEFIGVNEIITPYNVSVEPNVIYDERNANLLTFSTPQGQVFLPYPFWPTVAVQSEHSLLSQTTTLTLSWGSEVTARDDAEAIVVTSDAAGVAVGGGDLNPQVVLSSQGLGEKTAAVHIKRQDTRGDIIVVGTDALIQDEFIGGTGEGVLFTNLLVDIASQGNDLASIKAKNRIPPSLSFKEDGQKGSLRYTNIIAGPGLILLIGGVAFFLRRRKMDRVFAG